MAPDQRDLTADGAERDTGGANARLIAALFAVMALLGAAALAAPGYRIGIHEGDALHLLEILLRMLDGETPHRDFETPLGVLGFVPTVALMRAGWTAGPAMLLAQILLATILLPALWWIGRSRLAGTLGAAFGAAVLTLVMALIYGGLDAETSISMHYNRWSWAIAFVTIALAVLPPHLPRAEGIDGAIIGLGLAALVLIKVTYFVAFAVPVALILLVRGARRALLTALIAGLGALACFTLWSGPGYWTAYASDLAAAARSDLRVPMINRLADAIFAPVFLCASLTLVTAIHVLNRSGETGRALALLLLAPGFLFVSSQNYGNDPVWLVLVAVILLHSAAASGASRQPKLLAAVSLALVAPYMVNLAVSPLRHLTMGQHRFEPLVAGIGAAGGLYVLTSRVEVNARRWPDISNDAGGSQDRDAPGLSGPLADFGRASCEAHHMVRVFRRIGGDLAQRPALEGARIFVADQFSAYLLYGRLTPLPRGTPWYYSGLPGFENASHILVPFCPTSIAARDRILRAIEARAPALRESVRTPDYAVFKILRPG